jgi:YidC/Oxa1 family membrane protein insertase
VIRNNPAPGTPAAKAKEERDRAKAERHGRPAVDPGGAGTATAVTEEEKPAPRRQQPKKQSREQRKKSGGSGPSKQ